MKKALVLGAAGFVGSHLVEYLKERHYAVKGVDIQPFKRIGQHDCDEFVQADLTDPEVMRKVNWEKFDEIYQLAADMGGAGYIFTGDNDANIMSHSVTININLLQQLVRNKTCDTKVFYSSSACIYPEFNQTDPTNPNCQENTAYPAQPDSEYGWEKLFSERLYLSYARNYNIPIRIARFHNIFGPGCAWNNGKEKAPAALCRKIASSTPELNTIDIWGTGDQTRSFLYIDECLDGIARLMQSDYDQPVNLGSDRMISINDLAKLIAVIAEKDIIINNIAGPLGVNGRNSDNVLIEQVLGWKPTDNLEEGLLKTYLYIKNQIDNNITDY